MVAGAGFIIFRRFDTEIKVLGLIGPKFHRERCNGVFDVPKGTIDPGETAFAAAWREAKEEAGYEIELKNILAGPFINSMLTMWLAEVNNDPVLGANPNNGIIEHDGYEWLTVEELKKNCYDYLVPSVEWAAENISKQACYNNNN